MTDTSDSGSSRSLGPFSALLFALSAFILLGPIVGQVGFGREVYRYGFTGVLIISPLAVRKNKKIFGMAVVFVLVNLVDKWFTAFEMTRTAEIFSLVTGIGYLWFLVWALLRGLLRRHEATVDTVLGGINVYLIMALAFMLTHLLIERIAPGSYETRGVSVTEWVLERPLPSDEGDPFGKDGATENLRMTTTFLYFSFATLTTLGFGDIVPARPMAQTICSAEAVIGQMFVAIFIGGLVAQLISAVQERRRTGAL